ncbi:glycosyltransferase [Lysobacteraceae bacterium NML75-0749]|nr:glycosyltransferase [Xanthomonadaceae bacterium NML75-0749]PJK04893.1 glycosyltransferase [Xanthomonadaceae bacterium NML91-0268]
MSIPQPLLSIVSPVYGCTGCLEELAERIARAVQPMGCSFEVVLVDDASPDNAWPRIQELAQRYPWLRGIRLSRNFGQHAAISAGIEHARGEWVVVMDCDLQDPPSAIPALYQAAISQDLEVVFARRINRKDSSAKRLSSWGFFKLLGWLTGLPQDAREANFGIFKRNVITAVCTMPERDRSFPLMVKWAGFKRGSIDIEHAARAEGQSSYTLKKLLRLATSIALSYSEKPLQLVALAGVLCALPAFGAVILAVFRWLEGDIQVAGYTSIIASLWLIGSLLLFSLGVVGLYIGQVFRNVQGRPYYILAEDTSP